MPAHKQISASDIPENEIREFFSCSAAGPGGQHVNRTANTVRLVFDAGHSSLLSPSARTRLKQIAGCDEDGIVTVTCRETRSLTQNRTRAREILAEWINQALPEPRKRKKTKPSRSAREKRLREKACRAQIKAGRSGKYE